MKYCEVGSKKKDKIRGGQDPPHLHCFSKSEAVCESLPLSSAAHAQNFAGVSVSTWGFPGAASGKEPTRESSTRLGLDSWVG